MDLSLEFKPERETKGTWRLAEVVPDDGVSEAKVGTIYVRKATLAELGWKPDDLLTVLGSSD